MPGLADLPFDLGYRERRGVGVSAANPVQQLPRKFRQGRWRGAGHDLAIGLNSNGLQRFPVAKGAWHGCPPSAHPPQTRL